MRHLFTLAIVIMVNVLNAQSLASKEVKKYESLLDDVMELLDTSDIKAKLAYITEEEQKDPSCLHRARTGILYHEAALNLSFLSKTSPKGYAKKSYDYLNELHILPDIPDGLRPFVASYRASALALVSAETKNLRHLNQSFLEFERAIEKYGDISYCPEFLRGSVAENLPWFLFAKRKFAKKDFQSIINKYESDENYANGKIMSFTYWAWARQHRSKKYREKALLYLDKAIELDPVYKAGRKRAEELKSELIK